MEILLYLLSCALWLIKYSLVCGFVLCLIALLMFFRVKVHSLHNMSNDYD